MTASKRCVFLGVLAALLPGGQAGFAAATSSSDQDAASAPASTLAVQTRLANATAAPPSSTHVEAASLYERERAVQLYADVLSIVHENYVAPADELALTETALKEILPSLDGHSTYMTAEEYRDFESNAKEAFGGIGVVVSVDADRVTIMSPIDGGPALKAGVTTGWQIVSIGGKPVSRMTLTAVTRALRGDPGTEVGVRFKDPSGRAVSLVLKRETIHVASVYQRRIGRIGYIRITGFTQVCAQDFEAAKTSLLATGPIGGLVLDLRNNGGGFIDAAVAIASHFLTQGNVVFRTGRSASTATSTLAGQSDSALSMLPVVILINGGSASAAEIVAAALHDNHRATLVGETSYGKGLVQTIFPLEDGKLGAASITTARYYTPAGSTIHQVGVVPDAMVARNVDEASEMVGGASRPSEATLPHSLANELGAKRLETESIEGPLPFASGGEMVPPLFTHSLPSDADIKQDFQLQRALDILATGSIAKARLARPGFVYRRAVTCRRRPGAGADLAECDPTSPRPVTVRPKA